MIVNFSNPNALVTTGNGGINRRALHHRRRQFEGECQPLDPTDGRADFPTWAPIPHLTHWLICQCLLPLTGHLETNIGGGNKRYVLTPGRSTNLPTFNSGDVVILKQASQGNDGIYYIDGGGFESTGATITMDGFTSGGLMIYNDPHSGAQSEKIQITGNPYGQVDLKPLTSGPYQGMMLWQNRNSTCRR